MAKLPLELYDVRLEDIPDVMKENLEYLHKKGCFTISDCVDKQDKLARKKWEAVRYYVFSYVYKI